MKLKNLAVALVLLSCLTGVAFAAPVALTPMGQSPDGMMVRVVLKSLAVEADYDALMKPEALSDQKVLLSLIHI